MKKLFIAVMALATIVSCSKENEEANVTPVGSETAFLSVSLKSVGDMTRAEVGSYEYGSEEENAIENATFYFFDAAGNAYNVDTDNAVEVKADQLTWETEDTENTIAKFSDIVLVIKQHKDTPPAKMVALINVADPAVFARQSLADLQKMTTDFQTGTRFVMSNSVYSENGATVVATEILPENIFTTPDPADDVNPGDVYKAPASVTPVQIYVERVAAKVRVAVNSVAIKKDTYYPVYGADGNAIEDTFVKVLGWDVTNATTTSYLLKSYAETNLFSPVNNSAFHRSYWAATYPQNPTHGFKFTDLNSTAARYYHENTLTPINNEGWFNANSFEGSTKAAQLLVAAQLVDAEGNPKQFAKWYGKEYDCDPAALKAAMINNAAKQIFVLDSEKSTDAEKVYNGISVDDVTFYHISSDTEYDPYNYDGDRRYEVKVKAKVGVQYYSAKKDADGNPIALKADEVNAILEKIEPAMIWDTGYTYYYTMINHFGNANGMVRNHIYDINITSFNGLGTPVYEPDQFTIIIPETPIDQEAYHMTAQINVLQWALVSQDVALGN